MAMAVKVLWVLTSIPAHGDPTPINRHYDTADQCREAAIQEIESGKAKFTYCTEGYAAPLEYLPYPR